MKRLNAGIEICVQDNGCGVNDPEEAFDEGFTTKGDNGIGWGLTWSRLKIRRLRGDVVLRPLKQGTVACILLMDNI